MKRFDFDCIIDRSHTGARKTDELAAMFGRDDIRPMWIADMDFPIHPAICDALRRRVEHPVYGYAPVPDAYWQSIISRIVSHDATVTRQTAAGIRDALTDMTALSLCDRIYGSYWSSFSEAAAMMGGKPFTQLVTPEDAE